jgi:hypothetical protein
MVDATLMAAAVKRPYNGSGVNKRDPDARFMVKRAKAHPAVDLQSGLVHQAEMRSVDVHVGRISDACRTHAEALIRDNEEAFFADKAYTSHAFATRSMRDDGC